ncbi:MAG TPA: stage II sporulation protein M [Chitinophagales bacterium]|nr:stage II sporulation protein M [Chitinophagales bacterium]
MKETRFIKQNKEKWSELEGVLRQNKKNPDQLSELFVHVTDDLSYSRTFYPNRSVRVYLNHLAQRIFLSIYKSKKDHRNKFLHFWKEELPLLVYESRKEFLLSFLIFVLSFAIGVFSCMHDPNFARLILGDEYVEMTKEYIRSGDPMKVYKVHNGVDMFLGITINNLYVSFLTFISGLFFIVGSIGMLLYNGIMVGTFQYFFIERGLFKESFLTIWMHGTIEISCIIIAGAAGIVLGKGLVFPGTYSRLQSLQMSAQRSLKIMMGIAPLIVMAAFIESFITRITDVPDFIRLFVILTSAFLIVTYFIWYPIQKSRTSKRLPEIKIPASRHQNFDTNSIRKNGEIFGDVFIFMRENLISLSRNAFLIAAASATITWLINPGSWREILIFRRSQFLTIGTYFDYEYISLFFINTIAITINALLALKMVKSKTQSPQPQNGQLKNYWLAPAVQSLFASFIINAILFLPGLAIGIFLPLLFPVVAVWLFCMIRENVGPFRAIGIIDDFIRGSYLRMMGLLLMLTLVSFILFLFLDSSMVKLFVQFINWNIILEEDTMNHLYVFFMRFLTIFFINLVLPLSLIGFALQYFSLKEINDASHLKHRIQFIGIKNGR